MRSHKTGEYQLLLDSNINIMLHRMYSASSDDEFTVTIPIHSNAEQLRTIENIVLGFKCKVTFYKIEYGVHAGENREILHQSIKQIDTSRYDHIEYHVCNISTPIDRDTCSFHIYNSPVVGVSRPYAEAQYFKLLYRIEKGFKVNLSSKSQVDMLPNELKDKVTTNMEFFSPKLYNVMRTMFVDKKLVKELSEYVPIGSLFFPFRVSDPVYKFHKVIGLGKHVIVTDPNESVTDIPNVLNISDIHHCKKTIYMSMLEVIKQRGDIRIPIYEDVFFNYHISIIEMVHDVFEYIDFKSGTYIKGHFRRYFNVTD